MLRLLPAHSHARLPGLPIFLMLGEEAKAGGRDNGAEYFQPGAPKHDPDLDSRWSSVLVIYPARNYAQLEELKIVELYDMLTQSSGTADLIELPKRLA